MGIILLPINNFIHCKISILVLSVHKANIFANISLGFLCFSFSTGVLCLRPWSPTWFSVWHLVWAETSTPDCSRSTIWSGVFAVVYVSVLSWSLRVYSAGHPKRQPYEYWRPHHDFICIFSVTLHLYLILIKPDLCLMLGVNGSSTAVTYSVGHNSASEFSHWYHHHNTKERVSCSRIYLYSSCASFHCPHIF